jgi:hypothetical protein
MKLFFKHEASLRCERVVMAELKKLGLHYSNVVFGLGEADIIEDVPSGKKDALRKALKKSGIELMAGKKSFLVEKIKNSMIGLARHPEKHPGANFSTYLSQMLGHNYGYLANLFSASQGLTIEHFYITHKIIRVKELLLHDDLSISQIALRMGYSSVAHLSNQFRKITGISPSSYKKINCKK